MNRRDSVLALVALGLASGAHVSTAQQPTNFRIGFLSTGAPTVGNPLQQNARDSLRRAGYEEGRNLTIEWRFAAGNVDRLDELAQDLTQRNVALIIAAGNDACLAAMRATNTIPIVLLRGNVPVEMGLVKSLARPGGNVTGTTNNFPEAAGKVLEVLRDSAPKIKRVAILWDPASPGMRYYQVEAERAAKAFGLTLMYFEVRRPDDVPGEMKRMATSQVDSLYVVNGPAINLHLSAIAALALQRRIPSVGTSETYLEMGGLLYFGPDLSKIGDRMAYQVDAILRGAKPGDLPIEQPTNFNLSVNLKTARSLGLQIPQSLLIRATRVVE